MYWFYNCVILSENYDVYYNFLKLKYPENIFTNIKKVYKANATKMLLSS